MSNTVKIALAILGLVVVIGLVNSNADAQNDKKVTICHKQPQKQDITITVSESAVKAHVKNHGDTIGACPVMTTPPKEEVKPTTPTANPSTPAPTPSSTVVGDNPQVIENGEGK
jgi:hypothetical protein